MLTRIAVVVVGGDCGTRQMAGARGAKMGRGVLIGQWSKKKCFSIALRHTLVVLEVH